MHKEDNIPDLVITRTSFNRISHNVDGQISDDNILFELNMKTTECHNKVIIFRNIPVLT